MCSKQPRTTESSCRPRRPPPPVNHNPQPHSEFATFYTVQLPNSGSEDDESVLMNFLLQVQIRHTNDFPVVQARLQNLHEQPRTTESPSCPRLPPPPVNHNPQPHYEVATFYTVQLPDSGSEDDESVLMNFLLQVQIRHTNDFPIVQARLRNLHGVIAAVDSNEKLGIINPNQKKQNAP
ncbi:hypothetical protein Tco_0044779 [Tanacetum coccineum]